MSLDQQLKAIVEPNLTDGQANLAHNLKTLIYKKAPQWFDCLNYEDDLIFLEPALFAWFTDPAASTPLSQQLIGLATPCPTKMRAAKAISDSDGSIFVPRVGLFHVKEANTTGELKRVAGDWLWCPDGEKQDSCYTPILKTLPVVAPFITVGQGRPPRVAQRFFEARTNEIADVPVNSTMQYQYLQAALQLMSEKDTDLYEWICFCTRYIHLYRACLPNSFGSLSVHGAAFLNVPEDACVVFYLDDLAHQCGHVIFNSVTLHKESYLKCDHTTPLKCITGDLNDPRSVYSAYHGLFTYTLILRCLSRCLSCFSEKHDQQHVLARIAFYLRKFQQDLHALDVSALYTVLGKTLYKIFCSYYECYCDEFGDQIVEFDLSNQLYVFSWQRCVIANESINPEGKSNG